MSYNTLLNNIYASSTHNLSIDILKSERCKLNCFIKSEQIGNYPPRIIFDHKWHTVQKNKEPILKENSKALFCFNDEIIHISDIFLDKNFQSKRIVKSIISSIIYNIKKEYPTIKHITLKYLSSGILPWYKIGFDFYQIKDKIKVEELLEDYLIDIKDMSENSAEKLLNLKTINIDYLKDSKIDFDRYLSSHAVDMIPMYIKVQK